MERRYGCGAVGGSLHGHHATLTARGLSGHLRERLESGMDECGCGMNDRIVVGWGASQSLRQAVGVA